MLIFGQDPMIVLVTTMVILFMLGMGGMLYVMLRMLGTLGRIHHETKKTNTGPLTVVSLAESGRGVPTTEPMVSAVVSTVDPDATGSYPAIRRQSSTR